VGAGYLAAAANLTSAAERAREALQTDQPVLIVCAGRDGAFSLDDAYCAGRLASAIFGGTRPRRALNDAGLASLDLVRRYGAGWKRPLAYSRAGRELIRLGFRADVRDAARLDAYPVLPHFHERRITLVPVPV
jgi:2-phosphosulfolactate phosphatase